MPNALITGASRGFGLSLAGELAARDWDLVLDARGAADLEQAVEALNRLGSGKITGIPGDISDTRHLIELKGVLGGGGLDLLVNNASVLGPSPQPSLDTYPIDILRQVYEINVFAPLRLIQAFLPALRANAGTVVDITSDAAVEAYDGWGGYGSSKAALEQISNVLAAEEPDIHVYWFDPGDMNTKMHQEAFPNEDIGDRPSPEERVPGLLRLLERRPPSGRYSASEFLETVS